MKGLGTDEKAIITCLTTCSADQRQQLKVQYKTMYGKVGRRAEGRDYWSVRACVRASLCGHRFHGSAYLLAEGDFYLSLPFLQDLMSDLKSELSGRLEQVVLALMDPVPLFLAKCLRKAMKVGGEDVLCKCECVLRVQCVVRVQ